MTIEAKEDFDTAFAEFSVPDDKKPAEEPAAPTTEGAVDDKPGETPTVDDQPSGADDKPAADDKEAPAAAASTEVVEPAETKAAVVAPVVEEPKPSVDSDEILNRLAKIVSEKPAEAPAPAATEKEPEERPLYDAEETEFLTGYDKDWGDVVRGEALKRRAEYRDLLQYVFAEVGKFVAPLRETTAVIAERTHLADLKTNVPDYSDNLRDNVIAWSKTQPEYLQLAYDQVIQHGTADEVKDLVERYRRDTGLASAATPAVTPGKDNELSSEAKKAAAALAPVESKRSGVQQPGEPEGFDDAWKQFASSKD